MNAYAFYGGKKGQDVGEVKKSIGADLCRRQEGVQQEAITDTTVLLDVSLHVCRENRLHVLV
jgi:hypothetical protein